MGLGLFGLIKLAEGAGEIAADENGVAVGLAAQILDQREDLLVDFAGGQKIILGRVVQQRVKGGDPVIEGGGVGSQQMGAGDEGSFELRLQGGRFAARLWRVKARSLRQIRTSACSGPRTREPISTSWR